MSYTENVASCFCILLAALIRGHVVTRKEQLLQLDGRKMAATLIITVMTAFSSVYASDISAELLPTSQPCPREWKPFLDACYRYFPSLVTHEEAEGKCKATAGALLSVLNADESTFLLRTIFRTADSNDTWLGLRRDAQTNSWKWLDGSVYSWMNWEEPGRTGSHYRCARMRTTSGYWSAADVNCTELRTYTCKFIRRGVPMTTPTPIPRTSSTPVSPTPVSSTPISTPPPIGAGYARLALYISLPLSFFSVLVVVILAVTVCKLSKAAQVSQDVRRRLSWFASGRNTSEHAEPHLYDTINEDSMTPPADKFLSQRPRMEIVESALPDRASPTFSDPGVIYSKATQEKLATSLDSIVIPPQSPSNKSSQDYPYSYIEQGTMEVRMLRPVDFLSAPRRQRSPVHARQRSSEGSIPAPAFREDPRQLRAVHSLQGEVAADRRKSRATLVRIPKDFQKISCPQIYNDPEGFDHFGSGGNYEEGFVPKRPQMGCKRLHRDAARGLPVLILTENDRDSGWEEDSARSPSRRTNWGSPKRMLSSDTTAPSDSDDYSCETLSSPVKTPEHEYYTLEKRSLPEEPEQYEPLQMCVAMEKGEEVMTPPALNQNFIAEDFNDRTKC